MTTRYKYSQFNIVVEDTADKTLLYNTYTLKYRYLHKADYLDICNKSDIDIADVPVYLAECGFIVPCDVDEIQRLKDDVSQKINDRDFIFISVFLTLGCNYRCRYCFEQSQLCNSEYMSKDTADAIVAFVKKRYSEHTYKEPLRIKWFGGEPLLALDMIRYITGELKYNNIPIEAKIYTNGRLLTKEVALELKESLCVTGDVVIPIDGLPATYALQKGCAENDFYEVVKNIQEAQDILNIVIHINVSEQTKDDVVPLASLLRDKYHIKSRIDVVRVEPQNTDVVNADNSVDLDEVKRVQSLISEKPIVPKKRASGCEARWKDYYVVNVNGDLYRCEHLFGQKKYCYGNIRDYDGRLPLKNSIWDNNRIINDCRGCPILPICLGNCATNRYIEKLDCDKDKRIAWLLRHIKKLAEFNSYKISQYNTIADRNDNGDLLLFNTISSKGRWVPTGVYDQMKDQECIHSIDVPDYMIRDGYVVPQYVNELEQHNSLSDNSDTLELTVAVTKDCNYHCTYCFEKGKNDKEDINDHTIQGIMSFVSELTGKHEFNRIKVVYFGGEPLLNISGIKEIARRLRKVTDIPITGHLTTNGRYLTADILKDLDDCNIRTAQITMDGMPKEYARLKTCNESDFYEVIDNLKSIQDIIEVQIRINVGDNSESVKELIAYIAREKIKCYMHLEDITYLEHSSEEYLDGYSKYVESYKDIMRFVYNNGYQGYFGNIIPKHHRVACQAKRPYYYVIDTRGNMYKCPELVFREEYSIGSVFDGITNTGLNDLYMSNRLDEKCDACINRPLCNGKCTTIRCIYNKDINCEALDELYRFQIKMGMKYEDTKHNESC